MALAAPADARRPAHPAASTGDALASPPADFDGDGTADQARLDRTSGTITLRLSATRAAPSLDRRRPGRAPPTSAAIPDVDVDGDPDLVALTTSGRLIVWQNGGGGRLSPRITGPPEMDGVPHGGRGVGRAQGDHSVAPVSLAPAILLHGRALVGHVRATR